VEKYFFEIPIFRCTKEKYLEEIESEIQQISDYYRRGNTNVDYDFDALARKSFKCSGYRYAEMVGVIRLFHIPGQIRGELFFVSQRISKGLKNKTWSLKGKIFEIWIRRSDTNETIYKRILNRINSYQKESKRVSKCFIDKTCFETIGKHIDYISLQ